MLWGTLFDGLGCILSSFGGPWRVFRESLRILEVPWVPLGPLGGLWRVFGESLKLFAVACGTHLMACGPFRFHSETIGHHGLPCCCFGFVETHLNHFLTTLGIFDWRAPWKNEVEAARSAARDRLLE